MKQKNNTIEGQNLSRHESESSLLLLDFFVFLFSNKIYLIIFALMGALVGGAISYYSNDIPYTIRAEAKFLGPPLDTQRISLMTDSFDNFISSQEFTGYFGKIFYENLGKNTPPIKELWSRNKIGELFSSQFKSNAETLTWYLTQNSPGGGWTVKQNLFRISALKDRYIFSYRTNNPELAGTITLNTFKSLNEALVFFNDSNKERYHDISLQRLETLKQIYQDALKNFNEKQIALASDSWQLWKAYGDLEQKVYQLDHSFIPISTFSNAHQYEANRLIVKAFDLVTNSVRSADDPKLHAIENQLKFIQELGIEYESKITTERSALETAKAAYLEKFLKISENYEDISHLPLAYADIGKNSPTDFFQIIVRKDDSRLDVYLIVMMAIVFAAIGGILQILYPYLKKP